MPFSSGLDDDDLLLLLLGLWIPSDRLEK